MRLLLLFYLSVAPLMAADNAAIQNRIKSLREEARIANNNGQLMVTEEKLKAALSEASRLPLDQYAPTLDTLRELGWLYERQGNQANIESTNSWRVRFLEGVQKQRKQPVLELGVALMEMQSWYGLRTRNKEAQEYTARAKTFYESCKEGFPELRSVCDRGVTDVEGVYGSLLFRQKRFAEAVPFLQAVIAREDAAVRPEVLNAALMAYSQILIYQEDIQSAQPLLARASRIRAANPAVFPQQPAKQ